MSIEELRVIHLPKSIPGAGAVVETDTRALDINTCQRRLWVSWENFADVPRIAGTEALFGEDAYHLLLSVACGLRSELLGETNIFGQFKEAWERHSRENPRSPLSPMMQRLFEDVKDIRSEFLRGCGGMSYGALVRKLLKQKGRPNEPIVLIGAGEIAQAVAPWLRSPELTTELVIMNRDPVRAEELAHKLEALPGDSVPIRVADKGNEAAEYAAAGQLVFCIPYDHALDAERIRDRHPGALVIHLGGLRNQAGAWNGESGFHALDELFALQETGDAVRFSRLDRAGKACADRAKLRSLGNSLSIAHGWEDLAAFG